MSRCLCQPVATRAVPLKRQDFSVVQGQSSSAGSPTGAGDLRSGTPAGSETRAERWTVAERSFALWRCLPTSPPAGPHVSQRRPARPMMAAALCVVAAVLGLPASRAQSETVPDLTLNKALAEIAGVVAKVVKAQGGKEDRKSVV